MCDWWHSHVLSFLKPHVLSDCIDKENIHNHAVLIFFLPRHCFKWRNRFTVTDEHTNHITKKKKKPAISSFQRGCQGSFVSTNFSGWCCCQEILIHDKVSCKLGQWQTCRRTDPAVCFVLLLEVAPGCPGPWEAMQDLLTHQIPALVPWGCSWRQPFL